MKLKGELRREQEENGYFQYHGKKRGDEGLFCFERRI